MPYFFKVKCTFKSPAYKMCEYITTYIYICLSRIKQVNENSWHGLNDEAGVCFSQLMVCSDSCRSVNNFLMTGPKVRDIPLIYMQTLQNDFWPVQDLICNQPEGYSFVLTTIVQLQMQINAEYESSVIVAIIKNLFLGKDLKSNFTNCIFIHICTDRRI